MAATFLQVKCKPSWTFSNGVRNLRTNTTGLQVPIPRKAAGPEARRGGPTNGIGKTAAPRVLAIYQHSQKEGVGLRSGKTLASNIRFSTLFEHSAFLLL